VVEESYDKKIQIEQLISKSDIELEKSTVWSTEDLLKKNMLDYSFDFNVLPPTNRIVINKINLDVPLIDSKYKNEVDFTQWNFNEELENGVVKYPTTPTPGQAWNTLIFGHTSQERWQKNPYGTVFSKIPNLAEWDIIMVIWEWKLYEYKVVEKTIVTPSKVDEQYQKYQSWWKDYITLMWCYPLWRTDKRMMITAERVK
jgi:LPXTG-site transpeptidase (sortase) family protein